MDRLKNNLALALALGVAVYFAVIVFAGFGDLAAALGRFRWSLLPAVLVLVATSYAVRFLRWSYYLGLLGIRVPVAKNAAIFVAGLPMTVSPGKLGEVLKSVFVRRVTGDPVARTAPAVVAERLTDGTGMVAWGLLGGLAFGLGLGGLLLFLALAVAVTVALRSKRLSLLAERTFDRLPLARRLVPHLGDFHGSSDRLLAAGPLAVGTAVSFLSWGLEILAVHLCVVASGAEGVRFLATAFVFAAATLGGVLSMLPDAHLPAKHPTAMRARVRDEVWCRCRSLGAYLIRRPAGPRLWPSTFRRPRGGRRSRRAGAVPPAGVRPPPSPPALSAAAPARAPWGCWTP